MQHDMNSDHPSRILHAFAEIADYYNETTPNDMALSVIAGDTYLAHVEAKNLKVNIKKGDKLRPGGMAEACMKERRRVVHVYSAETSPFGVPSVVNALPIIDATGHAVGCVITTQSTQIQEMIANTATQLSTSSQALQQQMGSLGEQTKELGQLGTQLLDISAQTADIVKSLDDVLDLINSISSQTNLLGLNAAIEAARLGSNGKAFGVVADEIRNLARRSANSISEVTEALDSIKAHNFKINQKSEDMFKYVAHQAETVTTASLSSKELTDMAAELQHVADNLWSEDI